MGVNSTENGIVNSTTDSKNVSESDYKLKTFQSSLNLLNHIFIGIVVGASIVFAFRNGLPIGATPIHIVLCVLGYQLLMAEAILSLSPHNGWSSHLRLVDKRRAHWILLIMGSGLAIAGSIIKILDKNVNFNTLHGQFSLVALVFTGTSMCSGLTSLYAYELRSILPGKLSKIVHICFGIVGFVGASITLCYGFDKGSFKSYVGESNAYALIAFTGFFTFSIIINPFISFITKFKS